VEPLDAEELITEPLQPAKSDAKSKVQIGNRRLRIDPAFMVVFSLLFIEPARIKCTFIPTHFRKKTRKWMRHGYSIEGPDQY
jgi:hypothetical protein